MVPCVVIDTETTGFPNNRGGFCARIIEVGAVVVTADARVVSPISFFVRQDRAHLTSWQAQRAQKVHGISVDCVLREGLAPDQAAPRFATWISRVVERFGAQEVRAFNQGFDFWFLERQPWDLFARTGLRKGQDIKDTAKAGMRCKSGPRLSRAVDFANQAGGDLQWVSDAHRAEEDARMAALVAVFFEGYTPTGA